MRKIARKLKEKLTRRNVRWVIRTNVQSWVLQGAMVGGLTVAGVGGVAALVSAKVAAYVVFAAQCVHAARGESK